MPGLDGPQPGGALVRLNTLRAFDRECAMRHPLSRAPSNTSHTIYYMRRPWWLCVLDDATRSRRPELQRQGVGRAGEGMRDMGEMRFYKMLEMCARSRYAF